jgi:hypothetical protein
LAQVNYKTTAGWINISLVNQYLKKIRILHLETANNAHKSIASDDKLVFKARHDCVRRLGDAGHGI